MEIIKFINDLNTYHLLQLGKDRTFHCRFLCQCSHHRDLHGAQVDERLFLLQLSWTWVPLPPKEPFSGRSRRL